MNNIINAGRNIHESENVASRKSTGGGGTNNKLSPQKMAQAELAMFQEEALDETQSDMSLALGGRLRSREYSGNKETGKRHGILAQKLVAELALDPFIDTDIYSDSDTGWLKSDNIKEALQAKFPEPGKAVAYLAALLAKGNPEPRLRSRLEEVLTSLMGSENNLLSIFGALEFSVISAGLRHQLVNLFHKATGTRQPLSHWLNQLGERPRRKKLLTLIRLLAYELSASGRIITGSHLADVIGDLRQLLQIVSVEDYCDQTARVLNIPGVSGNALLELLIELTEHVWINAGIVDEITARFKLDEPDRYRLLQGVIRLVQLLPDECFNDHGHREQLENELHILRDEYLL